MPECVWIGSSLSARSPTKGWHTKTKGLAHNIGSCTSQLPSRGKPFSTLQRWCQEGLTFLNRETYLQDQRVFRQCLTVWWPFRNGHRRAARRRGIAAARDASLQAFMYEVQELVKFNRPVASSIDFIEEHSHVFDWKIWVHVLKSLCKLFPAQIFLSVLCSAAPIKQKSE